MASNFLGSMRDSLVYICLAKGNPKTPWKGHAERGRTKNSTGLLFTGWFPFLPSNIAFQMLIDHEND